MAHLYTREMKMLTAQAYVDTCITIDQKCPDEIKFCAMGLSGAMEKFGKQTFELLYNLSEEDRNKALDESENVRKWHSLFWEDYMAGVRREQWKEEQERKFLEEQRKKERMLESIYQKIDDDERKFLQKYMADLSYGPWA